MKNSVKRTTAAAAALSVLSTVMMAGGIIAGADGINVVNPNFEDDIWAADSAWKVDINWDCGATVTQKDYSDDTAERASGSGKGINIWFPSDATDNSATLYQMVDVPEGEYTVKAACMGENVSFKVALGDDEGSAAELTAWNEWKETSVLAASEGGNEKLAVIFEVQPGGYVYLDSVSIEVISGGVSNESSNAENTESSEAEASSSESEAASSANESTSSAVDTSKNNTIYNGNFEKVSETDLVGWTVDWKDELKIWYATAQQKEGRKDLNNNYLNIWAEKAATMSVKQKVHFTQGTYKIAYNLDANENVDTGLKVRVGSLVTTAAPKGRGWEKWTPCATDAFTIAEEGDYEVEFLGDLAADAWFCIDNVEVKDGSYVPATTTAASSAAAAASTASKAANTTAASTAAAAASSAADTTANSETGAGAAGALAIMAGAAAVMVVSRRKDQ